MRLSESASVSSSSKIRNSHSVSRSRKKHKKLDAICEKAYNRNRGVEDESKDVNGGGGADSELRRSTRVRRAPVLLDASPQAKKRRKFDKTGGALNGKRDDKGKEEGRSCEDFGDMEEESSWKSRLRSRVRNVSLGKKGGKRKLFGDLNVVKEEIDLEKRELGGEEEGLEGGKLRIVKSKRPDGIKASHVLLEVEKDIEASTLEEADNDRIEVEMSGKDDKEDILDLEGGNEGETVNGNVSGLVEKVESVCPNGLPMEDWIGSENVEIVKQIDEVPAQLESVEERENQGDTLEVGEITTNQPERGSCDGDAPVVMLGEKPLENENGMKVNKSNRDSADKLGRPQIKEGRRCGLCGGGTDGKPPNRLVHDTAESENEACSGSSVSEEPNYDIWDGFGDEPGWLGRLLGPINDRFGIAGIWVHQHCAVWSPEVYFAGLGCLKNVRAALCRGKALKCSRCGRRGATIGCRVDRCPKTYHLPCARADGCIFDHRKFLIACTDHRHLFQPQGDQYLYRIKKLKAKKMKLEIRKLSNDALQKDVEAEEKWLENCGEDEEFLKRESKRLHRDILRIAPVYIGGSESETGKLFQGWESVAGLQDAIRCMKEVVILPLLYPEFFTSLGLTPPRGVLLHGHPGTGKTLVVRALIGSCARGDKRIAYFARKGADCLGKYVGDAERQLRLLFQVAERCQPSIIFFDEIDGLAPQRTRQQDQTHSSVVSTLLALLDGLKSRGSVVVIGATNRPDALDPALRRPGRFDREIYFPLPSLKDRAAILSLHTQRWPKPVSGPLLQWIARRTADFAGADLQALCTQAAITALKRNFPLQKLLSAAGEKGPDRNCVPLPTFAVEERDWLEALSSSPPPCSRREAGIAANDMVSSPLAEHLISCLLQPLSILLVALYLDDRLWLPPPISKAATKIQNVIVSALDKNNVPSESWWAHVKSLLEEPDVAKKIEREISSVGILTRDATFAGSDLLNDDIAEGSVMFKFSKVHDGYRNSLLRNTSYALGKNPGFRILIAGSPRSGQRHLASCILHCFVGNFQIQKVDLATISQEGRGDVMQGLTQILMKCSSTGSCVLFMPRIDLWAIDAHHQVDKMETDSCSTNNKPYGEESHMECSHVLEKANGSCLITCESAEEATDGDSVQSASLAWSSFIEQVDSICMSTSLMIMATSEVPYQEVPIRIRQFFNNDISNYSDSTPGHTVPQFSVQVDGNYNTDVVVTSSATKLSRDVAQQFVQLIHQTTHSINTTEHDADVVCHSTDHGSANQNKVVTQPSEDSLVKVPLAANNRVDKGKSSLLLAISTFGYQILRFPHFAELCWVTSKLKDGPWADINGPWKGWPFNSCVVRPNFSLEKVAGACNSSIMKSKEKASVVRGLVAVGLSAYRGVYASLREVSLEVRKVLELLVGQINAKILAGKDQYQFVRILSQVAYLEDVVDSWAHTLQRLEPDGHVTGANLQPSCVRSPVDDNIGAEELVCNEQSKQNVSSRSSHELDGLSGNPHKSSGENGECIYLNDVSGCLSYPNSIGRVAMPEEGPLKQMVRSGPNTHLQNSTAAADGLDGKILNQQNGTNSESSFSENTGNQTTENGDYGSLKCSNEFAYRESADGPASSGDQVGVGQSDSIKVCNQGNGFSLEICSNSLDANSKPNEGFVFSNKTTGRSADRQIVCMYSCCSECLRALHSLMQKIIMHEWGLNGSYKTIEDIHDIVESLSTSLLLALRRDCGAESFRTSFDKKPRHENHAKLFEHKKIGACQCKNSEIISVMPMNCSCHSVTESLMDNGCTSPNPQVELATNFIYRDGVLVPVDSNQDAFVHCKFEALCLCSLVEWIAMTKQYLD